MKKYVYDPVRGEVIDPETGEVVEEQLPYEHLAFQPGYRVYDRVQGVRRFYEKPLSSQPRLALGSHSTLSPSDRKVKALIAEMSRIASELGLPKIVVDYAASIIGKVIQLKVFSKKYKVIGVTLAYSAMVHGYKFPFKEYREKTKTKIRLAEIMELEKTFKKKTKPVPLRQQVIDIISRIEPSVLQHALGLVKQLTEDLELQGVSPKSLAAAIIYILLKPISYYTTQSWLSEKLGISCISIRQNVKRILSKYDVEVYLE